jgi:hypothetical protein
MELLTAHDPAHCRTCASTVQARCRWWWRSRRAVFIPFVARVGVIVVALLVTAVVR